ncbi:MAG: helix-turn-helix domain-containing protein, partial [Gelidibacter sp.]
MNAIGKKIREVRKRKGLSQEELADSSKVNLRTI